MNRRMLLTAALIGGLAVVFGAFGAHRLKELISENDLEIWSKGVQYQFYHVFALLFLASFSGVPGKSMKLAYGFFTFGILLFSGSLYLLATRSITNLSFIGFIGPVTPVGGLLLLLGWSTLFFAALRIK